MDEEAIAVDDKGIVDVTHIGQNSEVIIEVDDWVTIEVDDWVTIEVVEDEGKSYFSIVAVLHDLQNVDVTEEVILVVDIICPEATAKLANNIKNILDNFIFTFILLILYSVSEDMISYVKMINNTNKLLKE